MKSAIADFIPKRIELFEKLYAAQQEEDRKRSTAITITLQDGTKKEAQSFVTTPHDIASGLSQGLAKNSIVARLKFADGTETLWDLARPFEADAELELLNWDHEVAREVFWHSSAHVLGRAMERALGCKLISGPPLPEGGFFYEARLPNDRVVTPADYSMLEQAAKELVTQKAPFQRLRVTRAQLLEMFEYNELKTELLAPKVPEDGIATVYRCGDLIDPCRGPHLRNTGDVKAMHVIKHGASYFKGKQGNPSLQRVYGITFPQEKLMTEWKARQAAAAEREHKRIGTQQELFMVGHEAAPGVAFWFPHGARIYNTLIQWMRQEQRMRGFEEVISPNLYHCELWRQSGHWAKYRDGMFQVHVEGEDHALKPMNCPGHCLMFNTRLRSQKELPIRWCDYGVLHRNELSGALHGLTRVRRFCQDDAHIFCTEDQITSEVRGALQFVEDIYGKIGFTAEYRLSTRPDPSIRLGTDELWDRSEGFLATALNEFCGTQGPASTEGKLHDSVTRKDYIYDGTDASYFATKRLLDQKKWPEGHPTPHRLWRLDVGGGAFYGPKVDIQVFDALGRAFQCATLQLDYNLPVRFNLKYQVSGKGDAAAGAADADAEADGAVSPDGAAAAAAAASPKATPVCAGIASPADDKIDKYATPEPVPTGFARPVMIHRAIFGSLERFIGIVTEHFEGGKWPFWLSPRQAMIVPVAGQFNDYAADVRKQLFGADFQVDVDLTSATLNKKVRNAQMARYNFALIVGEKEAASNTVSVRGRDGAQRGEYTIPKLLEWWTQITKDKDNSL